MGEISKNLDKVSNQKLQVPETLQLTKENYEAAGYTFNFDDNEQAWIEFNTLCKAKPDTVERTVLKVYRLKDRDSDSEKLVYFQHTVCKDFNNVTKECPVDEIIGLVPKPRTDKETNAQDQVVNLRTLPTHNQYNLDCNKSELEKLFNESKNSHKIVCYVGFTREDTNKTTNFIDEKKIILNQEAFVNEDIEKLMERNPLFNIRKVYKSPNKKPKDVPLKGNKDSGEIETNNLKDLLDNSLKRTDEKKSGGTGNALKDNNKTVDVDKEFEELGNKKSNK